MTETTALEPWEMQPHEGDRYALWVSRGSWSSLSGKYKSHDPYVALANQSDPNEFIELRTIQDVDDLVERLMQARKWLESKPT